MDKKLSFSAIKYSGAGDEDVLRLYEPHSGDPFDGRDLAMFSPLSATQAFEIEISPEIDPLEVIKWLEFDNEDVPDFDYANECEYPFEWLERYEDLQPRNGNIARLAVLRQGNRLWQIVGIPHEGNLILALRDFVDHYTPAARYFSRRVLIEDGFFADGPGPVSWSGERAILDTGEWLIEAHGGDSGVIARDTAHARGKLSDPWLVDWILGSPACTLFVLDHLVKQLQDLPQREMLLNALANLDFEALGVEISHHFIDDEIATLFDALRQADNSISELAKIFNSMTPKQGAKVSLLIRNVGRTNKLGALSTCTGLFEAIS